MGNGRLTGHRLKGACTFHSHSLHGLRACLHDKEGSIEIQQGWSTDGGQNGVVCLGLLEEEAFFIICCL